MAAGGHGRIGCAESSITRGFTKHLGTVCFSGRAVRLSVTPKRRRCRLSHPRKKRQEAICAYGRCGRLDRPPSPPRPSGSRRRRPQRFILSLGDNRSYVAASTNELSVERRITAGKRDSLPIEASRMGASERAPPPTWCSDCRIVPEWFHTGYLARYSGISEYPMDLGVPPGRNTRVPCSIHMQTGAQTAALGAQRTDRFQAVTYSKPQPSCGSIDILQT